MAMTTCKECQGSVSSTAKACPHCGAKLPHRRIWPWIVGTPVAFFVFMIVFGMIVGSSPEAEQANKDRNAISYCWDRQAGKSLDPATARFAASTCERMESDYRAKYREDP